jgi:Sulfotransferase domain
MAERPDFFIVGAAKCGTTALYQYLSKHPSVFMPDMKEPKFFCTDLRTEGGIRTYDEYRALFAAASAERITGEASCWYLYSRIAIERIMTHNPEAKIIVMLRYPVDAAHSLHAAAWGYNHENIGDFEAAWRVQAARLSGKHMPRQWPEPATLQYGAMYRYAEQVRRVLDHVPERQRHFIIYEHFFADPQRHYAETLAFLNLAPDENATFSVVNPAIGPRSLLLDQLLRKPPRWLKDLYSVVRPVGHITGFYPAKVLWAFNSVPRQKSPLRPEFRRELDRYFADDIAELEKLLGRRLWRQTSGESGIASDQDAIRFNVA